MPAQIPWFVILILGGSITFFVGMFLVAIGRCCCCSDSLDNNNKKERGFDFDTNVTDFYNNDGIHSYQMEIPDTTIDVGGGDGGDTGGWDSGGGDTGGGCDSGGYDSGGCDSGGCDSGGCDSGGGGGID